MNTVIIILLALSSVLFASVILLRLTARKDEGQSKTDTPARDDTDIMGRTKTVFAQFSPILPNSQSFDKEVNNSNNFTPSDGHRESEDTEYNEFFPDTDEVNGEEVELEELFAVTKADIRLDGSELVSREIALLQRIQTGDGMEEDERPPVESAIRKLDGSEFLRMLRENEAKAEKRNLELMKMLEDEPVPSPPENTDKSETEDISLEDFL